MANDGRALFARNSLNLQTSKLLHPVILHTGLAFLIGGFLGIVLSTFLVTAAIVEVIRVLFYFFFHH